LALTDPHMEPITTAIAFEDPVFRDALRAAVAAAGATVTSEIKLSEVDSVTIDELDEATFVINLEQLIAQRPEILETLLESTYQGKLLFNDAEATSRLRGADKARWVRHLASKISGDGTGLPPRPEQTLSSHILNHQTGLDDTEVWVLCASIGGPEAVRAFLAMLEEPMPFLFILVQHIGPEFINQMSSQLDSGSIVPVRIIHHGDVLKSGQVSVVPPDKALNIDSNQSAVLTDLSDQYSYTPCIDQVIDGLLGQIKGRINAIVFSGMADDGVSGAKKLVEAGGEVWTQDPATCVVSSMVDGATEKTTVSYCGDPVSLAREMNHRAIQLMKKRTGE